MRRSHLHGLWFHIVPGFDRVGTVRFGTLKNSLGSTEKFMEIDAAANAARHMWLRAWTWGQQPSMAFAPRPFFGESDSYTGM